MESGRRGYMEAPSISPPGRVPNRHLASPDSAIGFPAWRPVRYLIGSGVQGCCHFRKPDWSRSDCGRAGRITAPWGRAIHVDGRYGVRGTSSQAQSHLAPDVQMLAVLLLNQPHAAALIPRRPAGRHLAPTSWQTLGTDLDLDLDLNLDHLPSVRPPSPMPPPVRASPSPCPSRRPPACLADPATGKLVLCPVRARQSPLRGAPAARRRGCPRCSRPHRLRGRLRNRRM